MYYQGVASHCVINTQWGRGPVVLHALGAVAVALAELERRRRPADGRGWPTFSRLCSGRVAVLKVRFGTRQTRVSGRPHWRG